MSDSLTNADLDDALKYLGDIYEELTELALKEGNRNPPHAEPKKMLEEAVEELKQLREKVSTDDPAICPFCEEGKLSWTKTVNTTYQLTDYNLEDGRIIIQGTGDLIDEYEHGCRRHENRIFCSECGEIQNMGDR
jgi:hypothetical protein